MISIASGPRHTGTALLAPQVAARHTGTALLAPQVAARHTGTALLATKVAARHTGTALLATQVAARHTGTVLLATISIDVSTACSPDNRTGSPEGFSLVSTPRRSVEQVFYLLKA